MVDSRSDTGQISVLIADDDPRIRAALAACLELNSLLELAGSAADAEAAIRLAGQSQPDVALVDFHMPGGGQEAVRGILECSPATRIIALSGSDDRATVLEMVRAGAASYVVKGTDPDEIVETILRSARGESILSATVANSVIGELTAHLEHQELEESETRALAERIRRAISDELFIPVFQPIVDLATQNTVGLEALTRFTAEPAQSPDRWFADAEKVDLRAELELAAATAAVKRFAEAAAAGYLSLNLSPNTLPSSQALGGPVGGERLVIEITEHAAIDDYQGLAPTLNTLRDHGIRIAVDDAGAGFASLRHTLQLAPDFIKLDVSLTRGIDADRRRRALAAGLIGFANELDAAIIAEGVETAAEYDTLRALGVAYGQGHYFAQPAPLPDDLLS